MDRIGKYPRQCIQLSSIYSTFLEKVNHLLMGEGIHYLSSSENRRLRPERCCAKRRMDEFKSPQLATLHPLKVGCGGTFATLLEKTVML